MYDHSIRKYRQGKITDADVDPRYNEFVYDFYDVLNNEWQIGFRLEAYQVDIISENFSK